MDAPRGRMLERITRPRPQTIARRHPGARARRCGDRQSASGESVDDIAPGAIKSHTFEGGFRDRRPGFDVLARVKTPQMDDVQSVGAVRQHASQSLAIVALDLDDLGAVRAKSVRQTMANTLPIDQHHPRAPSGVEG